MILIVCVDNKLGMMFNGRRQSQDIVLRERVLSIAKGGRLLMNGYSAKMFDGQPDIIADDDFLDLAGDGDYVFAENSDPVPYEDKIEKIIVYRWNRDYPGDIQFRIDLDRWDLAGTSDFKGKSHEKITEDIYERGE